MNPTGRALRSLGFSARDVKLLDRIVAGGRAGGAGTRYEDWYAAYRLLQAALAHVTGGRDAAVEMQAPTFVNDVVVHDVVTDDCQAKTSPRATWDAKVLRQSSCKALVPSPPPAPPCAPRHAPWAAPESAPAQEAWEGLDRGLPPPSALGPHESRGRRPPRAER